MRSKLGMRAVWLSIVVVGLTWRAPRASAEDLSAHDYLSRFRNQSGAPGIAAAVSVHGRVVFADGIGTADLAPGEKQTSRTVINIGSVSKVETAVAVMQLVERGKVELRRGASALRALVSTQAGDAHDPPPHDTHLGHSTL